MVQIYFRSSKKNNVNKNNEIIRNRLVCSREQILSDILIILDSFQIFHVGYPGLRICQCPLEAIYQGKVLPSVGKISNSVFQLNLEE